MEGCVVVEDAPAGIEAARAAGMRVIGVTTTHTREELLGCEVIIDRLSALRIAMGDAQAHRGDAQARRLAIQIE